MKGTIVFKSALLLGVVALAACQTLQERFAKEAPADPGLAKIEHVIVIYAENRSFDNLYGHFPDANGLAQAAPEQYTQRSLDGTLYAHLPPVWTVKKPDKPSVPDATYPANLPNKPFRIDDPKGANKKISEKTRDLVHRFYQHKEQIDGGKLDHFAAVSDAGGLTMGHYDTRRLPMMTIARKYTLADNFFMGAFGGSFLNHFWLVCACTPRFADVPEGMRVTENSDGSAVRDAHDDGKEHPAQFPEAAFDPNGYAVNTVQPPYQPSRLPPASEGDAHFVDAKYLDPAKISEANPNAVALPPQTDITIGDRLTDKHVTWAWYAGAYDRAVADGMQAPEVKRTVIANEAEGSPNYQTHHQPFNYFKNYAPGTPARAEHLKDGRDFERAIETGTLPQVAYFKPQGSLNEHPGYADVLSGDKYIADIVRKIQNSPQWKSTLLIVTYDENGGFWDHVPPPKGDHWGPGSRIPAIIISPFARKNHVDHTMYDTTSISKFLTRRFGLVPLAGARADAGDLTNALDPKTLN